MHLTFLLQTAYQTYLQNPVVRWTDVCFRIGIFLRRALTCVVGQSIITQVDRLKADSGQSCVPIQRLGSYEC